jgi:hypothetical protein
VYSLDKYEFVTGKSGYKIILYYFSRLPDQAPPPWVQPLDQKAWTDEQLGILAEERRRHVSHAHVIFDIYNLGRRTNGRRRTTSDARPDHTKKEVDKSCH